MNLQLTLRLFPDYEEIAPEIRVRISELPVEEKIRDLRQNHLNCLLRVCARVCPQSIRVFGRIDSGSSCVHSVEKREILAKAALWSLSAATTAATLAFSRSQNEKVWRRLSF